MLLSKCVVATTVGSNAEIVEDGASGKLVDPREPVLLSDAISKLLSDPKKRADMGRKARERILALFSLDRMINEYEVLYDSLIHKKGS